MSQNGRTVLFPEWLRLTNVGSVSVDELREVGLAVIKNRWQQTVSIYSALP